MDARPPPQLPPPPAGADLNRHLHQEKKGRQRGVPNARSDAEKGAKRAKTKDRDAASRPERRLAERTRKWAGGFDFLSDGFCYLELGEAARDAVDAKYAEFLSKKDNGAHEYFGTSTAQKKKSGRWNAQATLGKSVHEELNAKFALMKEEMCPAARGLPCSSVPAGDHLLFTDPNVDQQMVHTDHRLSIDDRRQRTVDPGFVVIPATANGANLVVARGLAPLGYKLKDTEAIPEPSVANDLTLVTVPYGYALICAATLAHAGAATPADQPEDGRPRFHVYCGNYEKKTTEVRHLKGWPILSGMLMAEERPAGERRVKLLPAHPKQSRG